MSNENKNKDYYTQEVPILTVSQLSEQIRTILQYTFPIVKIKGQISNFTRHSSGHLYFSIKDNNSSINAICWSSTVPKLSNMPQNDMQIIAIGKLTSYEARSSYQITITDIIQEGVGNIAQQLEELKQKLKLEGVFDKPKKSIPKFPKEIGVITSPTGAVIHDIMYQINSRYPIVNIKLYPVQVQGEKSATDIASAITYFNKKNTTDLIIIARGGGSQEDLISFNDEKVVRAIFNSNIPIISAIGHETDTTLSDFVSDLRAPTPTAAAQIAVPDRIELRENIKNNSHILRRYVKNQINNKKLLIQLNSSEYKKSSHIIEQYKLKLMHLSQLLENKINFEIKNKKEQLINIMKILDNNNPKNIMSRGFLLISDSSGKHITSSKMIVDNEVYALDFHDGRVNVKRHKE